jgi:hypothetical protein
MYNSAGSAQLLFALQRLSRLNLLRRQPPLPSEQPLRLVSKSLTKPTERFPQSLGRGRLRGLLRARSHYA